MANKTYIKLLSVILTVVLFSGSFTETFAASGRLLSGRTEEWTPYRNVLAYEEGSWLQNRLQAGDGFSHLPLEEERHGPYRTDLESEGAAEEVESEEAVQETGYLHDPVQPAQGLVKERVQSSAMVPVYEENLIYEEDLIIESADVEDSSGEDMGDAYDSEMDEEAADAGIGDEERGVKLNRSERPASPVRSRDHTGEASATAFETDRSGMEESDVSELHDMDDNNQSSDDGDQGEDGDDEIGGVKDDASGDKEDYDNDAGSELTPEPAPDPNNSNDVDGQGNGTEQPIQDNETEDLTEIPAALEDDPVVLEGALDTIQLPGSGTEDSPFLIGSEDQLLYLASLLDGSSQGALGASAHYKLTADLDLRDAAGFYGIGSQAVPFQGVFDGDGHTVQLNISYAYTDYVGLFRYVKDASIMNINLEGSVTGNDYVGSIAGYLEQSTIAGVQSNSAANGKQYTGGIAGYVKEGSLIEVTNYSETNGSQYTGGIAGYLEGTVISEVENNEAVKGAMYAGGIAGHAAASEIKNSRNNGSVTTNSIQYAYIGGIAGRAVNGTLIEACTNTANIKGQNYAGGIAGYFEASTVKASSVSGSVYGNNLTGGIVGYLFGSSSVIQDCVFSGEVISGTSTGMISGSSSGSGTIENNGFYIRGKVLPADAQILIDGKRHEEEMIERSADGSFTVFVPVSKASTGLGTLPGNNPESISFVKNGYSIEKIYLSENNQKKNYSLYIAEVNLDESSVAAGIQGDGTKESPFLIDDGEQLLYISMLQDGNLKDIPAMEAYYSVEADLDLSSALGFHGIGSQYIPFSGIFKGNSHKITLNISASEDYTGLFGFTNGAELQDVVIDGNIVGASYTGGVVGYALNTTVDNISVIADVSGTSNTGGAAGYAENSFISKVTNRGEVRGSSSVGGIAGSLRSTSITDLQNYGPVVGSSYVGGIVGRTFTSEIRKVGNFGNISTTQSSSSSQTYVGGVAGQIASRSLIEESSSIGEVRGKVFTGGITGYSEASPIRNSSVAGTVYGTDYTGGIAGYLTGGLIEESRVSCSVSGSRYTGGIAGNGSVTIRDSSFEGEKVAGTAPGIISGAVATNLIVENSGFYISGKLFPKDAQVLIDDTPHDEQLIERKEDGNFSVYVPVSKVSGGSISANAPESISFLKTGYDVEKIYLSENNAKNSFTLHIGEVVLDENSIAESIQGEGTAERPFLIEDGAQFLHIVSLQGSSLKDVPVLEAYYQLESDLIVNDQEMFLGIGSAAKPFRGVFDGNGHKITLTINNRNEDYIGLFRYTEDAHVTNLSIDGYLTGANYVGGVAGYAKNTKISNVEVTADIAGSNYVGGVAGYSRDTSIHLASNFANVRGTLVGVGGITGTIYTGEITDSRFEGSIEISSSSVNISGIAGFAVETQFGGNIISNSNLPDKATLLVGGGRDNQYYENSILFSADTSIESPIITLTGFEDISPSEPICVEYADYSFTVSVPVNETNNNKINAATLRLSKDGYYDRLFALKNTGSNYDLFLPAYIELFPKSEMMLDVLAVKSPENAEIDTVQKTVTASVMNTGTINVVLETSVNTTWKLYSDPGCSIEIANRILTLSEGQNTAYILISGSDGSSQVYTLNIFNIHQKPSLVTGLLGIGSTNQIQLRWDMAYEAAVSGYNLYRSEDPDSGYTKIATISSRNTLVYTDQNVVADRVYYYKISAFITSDIESDLSDYVSITASSDMEPPVVLGISPVDGTTIGKYTNITVYLEDNTALKEVWLEYQIDKDWHIVETKSVSGTSASVTFQLKELTYEGPIKVRALAGDQSGNVSDGNPVRSYYLDTTGPQKVTGFSGTPTEDTITLKWNDVPDDDFAYFTVEQKNEGQISYKQIAKVTETLGYHVTGLTPNTNYWFRVRAFDLYDNPGEYSDEIQVYTQSDSTKPQIISIRPMPGYYSSEIPVTVNASDNIAVTSVEVEISGDGISWSSAAFENLEKPSKNITAVLNIDLAGIPEGAVFVRAFVEDAAGNRSNPSSVVEHRVDRTPPSAPEGLRIESTAEYILLKWDKGSETDIKSYSVYRADGEHGNYEKVSSKITTLGYSDKKVVYGRDYFYKVTAVDAAGNESEFSAAVSGSLAEDTAPPWIYSISPRNGSTLGQEPVFRVQAKDNVDVAQIIVEYLDAGDWYTIGNAGVSGTSASASFNWDTDGLPGGEYTVRFYAVDRAGNVSESYEFDYELKSYLIERPIAVLTPGDMSITIAWDAVSHSEPVRYKLYRIDDGRDILLAEIDIDEERSYTDHRLDPNRLYEYFVEVYDAFGNLSVSEVVSGQPVNNDPYPPVADAGFNMNTLVGVETAFNGDQSTDNIGIAKYLWDFGDGTFGEGEKTVHVYEEKGTYTVTLTVEDAFGNQDSDSIQVKALLPSQAGTVQVKVIDNETGEFLSDATVYIDLPEEPMLLRTDANGEVFIAAEPGTYGVSAYKIGYLPKEISVKVEQYTDSKTTLGISKGELVIGEIITERLTLDEIGELGIDTSDPDNQHFFNFEVTLEFQGTEFTTEMIIDQWGNFYGPGGPSYGGWTFSYGGGGSGGGGGGTGYVHAVPSKDPEVPPSLVVLTVTNSVSFMKEFYSVSVVMQNMADPQFVLTDNTFRINLPKGLSLADTAEKQDFVIKKDDLPGGEVTIATWILRGDETGSYKLSVNYNGTLMPFEEPVEALFTTDEELVVDGGKGLRIYVMPEEYAFPGEDYYIMYAVYNGSGLPKYNIKASFGTNLPSVIYNYTLVDDDGNESRHTSTEGTTYVVETPDQMSSIPMLTSNDCILVQTLQPGEAFYGYYSTPFPSGDPEMYYYELINSSYEVLGGSSVDIPVIFVKNVEFPPGGYWDLGVWDNGSGINDLGYFELEEEVLKVTGVNEIPFKLRHYSGYKKPHEDDVFNKTPDEDTWDFPATGWSSNYELKAVSQVDGSINLYLAPGIPLRFLHENTKNRVIPGELKNGNVHLKTRSSEGDYYCKDGGYQEYKLVKNRDGTIVLTDPEKNKYYFDKDGELIRTENRLGQIIEVTRDKSDGGGRTTTISEQGSSQRIIAAYDASGNLTGVRDNLGREVQVEYERTGEGLTIGSLITSSGDRISYEYEGFNITRKSVNGKTIFSQTFDGEGRVTSMIDGEGNTAEFQYDSETAFWQTIMKSTDRNSHQQVTVSNRLGQTSSEKNGLGHTTYYTYNLNGDMTAVKDANGNTRIFDYDEDRNLLSSEDAEGIKESITYDSRGNMLTFTTETGAVTTYTYSDKNRLTEMVDERGVITEYTYNEYGQILTETVSGLGTTHYTYENGRPVSITDVLGQTERFQYDAAGRLTESTDSEGNTTRYTYDAMDQVIKVTDPRGFEIHYTYDDRGNVLSETDQRGNKTYYQYDGNDNLIEEINALGDIYTYEYDGEGNLVKEVSPEGSFVEYVYDAAGQQTAVIDPEEGVTLYEYDPAGQLVKTIYPNGGVHTIEYDRSGRRVSETSPISGTTTYQYNDLGQLVLVTDPVGNTERYTYDISGNQLSVRDGEGGTTTFEYDAYSRLISRTDAEGNTTAFEYDAAGRLVKEVDPFGNETSYSYNGNDQLIREMDAGGGETVTTYNEAGSIVAVTNALGHTVAAEYDEAGNLTVKRDAYGTAVETITYDALNRQVASTDALGNTKRTEYDALGRTIAEITALNEVTTYTYNKKGELLTRTEPEGGVTVYTYDAEGNVTSLKDPIEGLSLYEYDAAGNLVREKKASGGVKTYTYDAAGRLVQSVNARGQQFQYTYDRAGRMTEEEGIHYTYDSSGNVLSVTNSEGTVYRTYDALNRVKTHTDVHGDTIRYAYDETGNLVEITYPDGKAVQYAYDLAGQMTSVTDYAGRVTSYQYNENSNLVKTTYSNGVAEEIAYGLNGWMESRTSKMGTALVSSGTYTYDGNGNLIVEVDDAMRARNIYDKNGRLTGKTDTWYTGRKDTFAFTYDAGGNMLHENLTSRPGSAGRQTSMSYGPGNQAEQWNGQALSFDPDGNMTRGPLAGVISAFEYDQRNQLVRAGGTSYAYDGFGTRVGQNSGGRNIQYTVSPGVSLSQLLVKKDGSGTTYYVYGNGLISQEYFDGDGGREYRVFHYDFRGSTVAMTDQHGSVTDRITYDPYGEITSRSGDTDTIFLYNGKWGVQTDENELLYMRARYYSTDLKRFINEDPEKDRVNWYIYGNSNPVNYIDPEGTIPILAIVGVGMWAHSAYSLYRAAKSGDRFGMLMSGIGLIPGGKLLSSAGRAMRGLSSGARVLGGRVGTSLARSLSGAVRSSSAKLSSVIKTASGSALRTAPKIRVAGNGSRASVQSRLGGLRPKGGSGGVTGAYNGVASSTGQGLGLLANKEIKVTQKGYDIVKEHINSFDYFKPNEKMLSRLRYAMENNVKITGADASFYMHELAESTMMRRGLIYDAAHLAALQKYKVSPFSVYHPEAIKTLTMSEWNSGWPEFWNMQKW